jgi:transposase-like protein
MKGSRFSEGQVIAILREQEAGARTEEVCRRYGISSATLYLWTAPPWQEGPGSGLAVIDCKHLFGVAT